MKKTVAAISGVVLLAALTLPLEARAKGPDPFAAGTAEIGVNFGPPAGPYVGLFVKDDIELGGAFVYSKDDRDTKVGLDAWARYFFPGVDWGGFRPFVEGGVSYSETTRSAKGKPGEDGYEEKSSDSSSSFSAAAGVKHFFSRRVAGELRAAYDTEPKRFYITAGLSVFIGE